MSHEIKLEDFQGYVLGTTLASDSSVKKKLTVEALICEEEIVYHLFHKDICVFSNLCLEEVIDKYNKIQE
jgi:hypothetical protein